jgi:putative hydrolase of the HAD superfamily
MIFFDLDDTLFDHKGAEYSAVKASYYEYGVFNHYNEDEFYKLWFKIARKYFNKYLNSEFSFQQQRLERVKEVFYLANIALDDVEAQQKFDIYKRKYEENWKAFDDVVPCLEDLKDYRLGIISNGDLKQQTFKLEKIGIKDFFEIIVTAGDIGVSKPDTKILEIACKRAGKKPEDCLYIGDDLKTDILPCGNINMKSIWLNRQGESTGIKGVATIESLSELRTLF